MRIALEELKKRSVWILFLAAAVLAASFFAGRLNPAMVLGVLLGTLWGCLEFLWMGRSLEATLKGSAEKAAPAVASNYLTRLAVTGVLIYLSFVVPFIDPAGFIIALFFPRISIYLNALIRKEDKH